MAGAMNPNAVASAVARRKSEKAIVLMKPGNAGRGKGLHFWCAFKGTEGRAIGHEPANTRKNPDAPEKALLQGEGGA